MTARSIELACGWWLAAILVWAAIAKLRAPDATRRSFAQLGLRWPEAIATGLPVAEIAVAVALVVWPAVGGAAATVLLAAFTVVIVRVIASGARVPCACFGAAASSAVAWPDVVRNLGLVVVAVLAGVPSSRGLPSVGALVLVGAVIGAGALALQVAVRRS